MMATCADMGMGERLKARRKELGLSVASVAKLAGLRPTTLYDLEREEQQATTRLHALCKVLGVTTEWAETGRGPRTNEEPPGKKQDDARWTLHGMQISTDEVELGITWGQLEEPARSMIREHVLLLLRQQRRAHRQELADERELEVERRGKPHR